ncbi:MAG: response regulator transcription factor [Lachnospiraceae bacterium]
MEHKGNILLVEDNEDLNSANSRALQLRGFAVWSALTLEQARLRLLGTEPDIILLDVMLPDGDGLAFCREIRECTAAHILFLTAKTEHEDMVQGLCGGGDDYITKPFHPEELLARIEAVMRRRRMDKSAVQILEKGSLTLDVAASHAFIGNINLDLTPKEFSLVFLLLQHTGEPLSKEYLYEQVWKQPMQSDSAALRQHLSRLKRKLEAASGGSFTIFVSRTDGYSLECAET